MISILFLYFLFGSAFTFGKIAISYLNPIFFIAIRMTIAGSFLLLISYFRQPSDFSIRKGDRYYFFKVMLSNIYIAYILEFWSLQFVTAAKASLIYNLAPFITALIAYFILSERLTKKQWFGLFIGLLGLIPMLLNQGLIEQFTWHVGFISLPEFLLILSVTSASYGWIAMKELMHRHPYSLFFINGSTMLVGGVLAFITSFLIEGRPYLIVHDQSIFGLSPYATSLLMLCIFTFLLILVANVLAFNIYGLLLKRFSTTFISFAGFTTPLFTALLDWILLGEIAPLSFFISIAIIMVGLYIFYLDELKMETKK